MSNGGMVQVYVDGHWINRFPTGYKPQSATINAARKWGAPARLIDRDGKVLFEA